MRALTLRQPWASLVALGVKRIETRPWSTKYRGPLLIHAGKQIDHRACSELDWALHKVGMCCTDWQGTEGPGLGAVIAVAELVDVVPIVAVGALTPSYICEEPDDGDLPHQQGGLWLIGVNALTRGTPRRIEAERPFGDFTPGRYAWLLDNVRAVDPIDAKGRQGLWAPDSDLIAAVSS